LYDRKAIFYRAKNKYLLVKDGIEYFVRAHKLKNNYTLINSGQMKRMINSCKQFLLMVVKEKKPDKTNAFEGAPINTTGFWSTGPAFVLLALFSFRQRFFDSPMHPSAWAFPLWPCSPSNARLACIKNHLLFPIWGSQGLILSPT